MEWKNILMKNSINEVFDYRQLFCNPQLDSVEKGAFNHIKLHNGEIDIAPETVYRDSYAYDSEMAL